MITLDQVKDFQTDITKTITLKTMEENVVDYIIPTGDGKNLIILAVAKYLWIVGRYDKIVIVVNDTFMKKQLIDESREIEFVDDIDSHYDDPICCTITNRLNCIDDIVDDYENTLFIIDGQHKTHLDMVDKYLDGKNRLNLYRR